MLAQYSYNSAMTLLDLLKSNKIAYLCIKEQDNVTAIEYKLISELPHPTQVESVRILGESLNERLYLIKLLNDFIVTRAAGRDAHLEVKFNTIRTKKLEFTHQLVGNLIYSNPENTGYERVLNSLEVLEKALTDIGVSNQQLVNVYRKEGFGRSKKHVQLTLGDLLEYIRKAAEK